MKISLKSFIHKFLWCRHQESNSGPSDYKSAALPTELCRHEHNYSDYLDKDKTENYNKRKFKTSYLILQI